MKAVLDLLQVGLWACTLLSPTNALPSGPLPRSDNDNHWITAWTAMPQLTEPANLPSGIFVWMTCRYKHAPLTAQSECHTEVPGYDHSTDTQA